MTVKEFIPGKLYRWTGHPDENYTTDPSLLSSANFGSICFDRDTPVMYIKAEIAKDKKNDKFYHFFLVKQQVGIWYNDTAKDYFDLWEQSE